MSDDSLYPEMEAKEWRERHRPVITEQISAPAPDMKAIHAKLGALYADLAYVCKPLSDVLTSCQTDVRELVADLSEERKAAAIDKSKLFGQLEMPLLHLEQARRTAAELLQSLPVKAPGWTRGDGVRQKLRDDGWPTRSDIQWLSAAELAIVDAMREVENAGGSIALTDAITLLSKARARVADHVEGEP
jgi:hypothetical protein